MEIKRKIIEGMDNKDDDNNRTRKLMMGFID